MVTYQIGVLARRWREVTHLPLVVSVCGLTPILSTREKFAANEVAMRESIELTARREKNNFGLFEVIIHVGNRVFSYP